MKIISAEYIVFDSETTGLSVTDGDRIIEIAAVKIKNCQIVDRFSSLINPHRSIPQESTLVNGITEDMIKDAPVAVEVLPQLIDFIGGACLVGHNVRFDLNFLCYELSLMGRRLRQETPAIDTLKMAKELVPFLNSYRLEHVAQYLGVAVKQTHRAMADTETTASVLSRLLVIAKDRYIENVNELLEQFSVEKPNYPLRQQETVQGFLF